MTYKTLSWQLRTLVITNNIIIGIILILLCFKLFLIISSLTSVTEVQESASLTSDFISTLLISLVSIFGLVLLNNNIKSGNNISIVISVALFLLFSLGYFLKGNYVFSLLSLIIFTIGTSYFFHKNK